MIKKLLPVVGLSVILASCGGGKKGDELKMVEAKGGVVYGGIFKINEVEDFKNLFPLSINDISSHHIASQMYQGLLKFDQQSLEVVPCIAQSFDVNEDATLFTFTIRKGVKFHEDECFGGAAREVTANDFKYCFDRLCTASGDNKVYWLFKDKVKGANEHYAATSGGKASPAGGVAGIKVIDDYTLSIELNFSFSAFPKIIAHSGCWVYPREAYEKYKDDMRTKVVGTGPFVIKSLRDGQMILLEKNENYWEQDEHGNQLPYLQGVKFTFHKEKKTELMEFRKKNLDMVWKLPVEEISSVLGSMDEARQGGNVEFELQQVEALSIQFYAFLSTSKVFEDKRVRQAFNHAIDREKLVTYTLQGEGTPASFGIVPPSLPNYPSGNIKGFNFDPDKARRLMSEAGFPNGRGFPVITLQLNSGGTTNELLAEAIQSMLKENLGVTVKLDVMPLNQLIEEFESGKADFWRSAWVADYPDPENYLNLFYGKNVPENPSDKSYINFTRYRSDAFDEMFSKALRTTDEKERMELFAKCDQLIVDDAVVMPLYYDNYIRLVQTNVRNFPINAMEYRDLSRVYFAIEEKGKKKKKKK
ncbi:MAG TPA: ABC transporter substrate-binding protein [Flavobacteriales bacterium]|mgnify:CR=1 FL=1|nr:ABC transporter substrate-binding protein [Flavobacteriales bacterium]HRE73545.1 ABC transporter substrate-binding protein [Flavobacteriales bacterium]HRE98158.1 ABC transporter substrate-binding protein [Flavobacteriales bacterium]HRJ34482.1 ABC transporter substrate-binding protein [Flavobacteriales bacterium]HRJ37322.1 ABC transporter substrate-binding protein [Flavobacteriales bacterium]